MQVAYLGPPGTFAEEALLSLAAADAELDARPLGSVAECFEAVRAGTVPEALVPIENSIEGSVNQTLDLLFAAAGEIVIRAEVVHPIRHHLIARTAIRPEDVEEIVSHPQAPPQCRVFLAAHAPTARIAAANSTAEAVRTVSRAEGPIAAIGNLRAADLYGCEVIAADIEDEPSNSTRFVLIGREPAPATGPGRFRTSAICAIVRDRPGALLAILQELALRGVNLTKLESRPAKTGLGRYVFFLDIEGSRERDLAVGAALQALEEQGVAHVTFLGSYPAAAVPD